MYSDMSKRIKAWSLANRKFASARASSVLPTPVGPRNMYEAANRSVAGFFNPARDRRIAREIAGNRFFLADHPAMQLFFHPEQLVALVLVNGGERHAGPFRDHFVNFPASRR